MQHLNFIPTVTYTVTEGAAARLLFPAVSRT